GHHPCPDQQSAYETELGGTAGPQSGCALL
ncbi:MAG: hypothetical protein AVDCRST_MAG56-4043, partial [uncultured Cytophagales bacterium]